MDVTLSLLVEEISSIIQDSAFDDASITLKLNQKQKAIAAGVRMPDGSYSPPLPDLYKYSTVTTSTSLAYVSLPTDYQRHAFRILDDSGDIISCPIGGDYYAFNLFMKQIQDLRLTESGSIYKVAIKGTKLYYQGIPTAAETIGVHYYRKPTDMALDDDSPDGIPEHLQLRLLKHGVLADLFGEAIEDGQDNSGIATKYHTAKFYEAMTELCDFIGIDAEPQYYGSADYADYGTCDG